MRVLVLHTLPPGKVEEGRIAEEFDLRETADEVVRALPGATLAGVRGDADEVLALLEAHAPEVVFNLCEAPLGRPDLEAHVAALLELQSICFTGSGSDTLALCRRKDHTNAVLAAAGIPVPRAGGYPCIVKPAGEDGSAGIDVDSVCADCAAVQRARGRIDGPSIVEEFLSGKEFVVSLWGRNGPEHVSIGEVFFDNGLELFTYAAKWRPESPDFANARLHYHTAIAPELREAIVAAARGAWRAVGARGYLRIDLRLDGAGKPRVIDVNPNPEMTPDMGMHRAVTEAGWSWQAFIQQQVEWAKCPGR